MAKRVFRESDVNRDEIGRFAEEAASKVTKAGASNKAFLAKFSAKIAAKAAAGDGNGLSGLSGMKTLTPAQQAAKQAHEGKNAAFLAKFTAKIEAKQAADGGGLSGLSGVKGAPAVEALDTSKLSGVKLAGPDTLPKKGVSLKRTTPKVVTPAPSAPAKRDYKPVSAERAAELQAQMLKGKPWTTAQRDSLNVYTGVRYTDMNGALRYGGGGAAVQRHIANARAGMRETPEDITVYRGAGRGTAFGFGKGRITNAELDALVGKTWSDPGFTSTATRKGGYGSGLRVQTVINVPAGTRGAFVEGITQNKGEDEFVLDAGTHYKITRYERHKGGKVTLHMEVVKQDA